MKILAYGLTDQGLSRKNNEDSFYTDKDLGLFIVADGMGGYAAGEVASRKAVETLNEALMIMASDDLPESACTRLVDEANNNGGRDNITVVAAFFQGKSDRGS